MARKSLAYLKAKFVKGYVPMESDYADLFDSCARNYGEYEALLTQSATSAPSASIGNSDLDQGNPALARTGAGVYTITLANAFAAGKTFIYWPPTTGVTSIVRTSASVITITCTGDGIITDFPLHIKVYN